MRYLGGLQTDPMRPELHTLESEPKRGPGPGGLYYPPCGFPVCVLRQTGAQSVGNAAYATITMDVADIDNDGMADLANDQVKIKFPGAYACEGSVSFAANTTGYRFARLNRSGTQRGRMGGMNSLDVTSVPTAYLFACVRGDTIKLEGFQASGGALNTSVIADGQAYLAVYWVGPTE